MLQLYMDLASSRLACRDIQRIQLYSYTRYTAYSTIQPPSGIGQPPILNRHEVVTIDGVVDTLGQATP